jgi:hypothetical protein
MRRLNRATALLISCALAGCSNAPLCRYWTDAPISKSALDPSAVPMLPENPYWVTAAPAGGAAPPAVPDACAGEPGHPTASSN